jgi:hypothetical protein
MPLSRSRLLVASAVVVVLGAVIVLETERELATQATSASATTSDNMAENRLSAEEEAYAAALWPIHSGVVETSAVELTFAGVDYVTQSPDRERLGERVLKLNDVFRGAAAEAQTLAVPRSMQRVHDRYMEALSLYVNASAEMRKTADDGGLDHLLEAQSMSQRAAEDLLIVGDVLWPGEHKPN